jgi:hypothetical protein
MPATMPVLLAALFAALLPQAALASAHCSRRPHALVISMDDGRFEHTARVLRGLRFRVQRVVPPRFDSAAVVVTGVAEFGRDFANYTRGLKALSHRIVWETVVDAVARSAGPSSCWHYVFEDDIDLHPAVSPSTARELFARGEDLAHPDGFMYLGICGSECESTTSSFKRCAGQCAHALAFTPERAVTLVSDAYAALPRKWTDAFEIRKHLWKRRWTAREPPPSYALDRRMYFDQPLLFLGRRKPALVVGANLKSPDWWDHYGVFYQKRTKFPSTLGSVVT